MSFNQRARESSAYLPRMSPARLPTDGTGQLLTGQLTAYLYRVAAGARLVIVGACTTSRSSPSLRCLYQPTRPIGLPGARATSRRSRTARLHPESTSAHISSVGLPYLWPAAHPPASRLVIGSLTTRLLRADPVTVSAAPSQRSAEPSHRPATWSSQMLV